MPLSSLPALTALIDAARALPGEREVARVPLPAGLAGGLRPGAAPSEPELRAHVRGLLDELAARLEPALQGALQQVDRAWDQVDALRVVDPRIDDAASALRHACQRALVAGDPSLAATATQALWTAEAALGLTQVLERRLATFVRLRLRAADPRLELAGRPFLDVARALSEAARAW
jgi:hypothetical protein